MSYTNIQYGSIVNSDTEQVVFSCCGKPRCIRDIDRTERLFVALSCLSLLATAVLSIDKMATTSITDTDFTFALFILVNAGFCVFYVINGVLKERAYELGILLIAVFGIDLYIVLNFGLVHERGPVKIMRFVIICVMSPPIMILCVKYGLDYYRSGNLIFRTIGANVTLQKICKIKYLFQDMLLFDLHLGISMVILILNSTVDIKLDDYIVLPVGGVFSIIWCIVGFYSSYKEEKVGMWIFFIGSVLEPGYVGYKMYMSAKRTNINLKSASLTCGCVALLFRVLLMICSYYEWKNFGEKAKELRKINEMRNEYENNGEQ